MLQRAEQRKPESHHPMITSMLPYKVLWGTAPNFVLELAPQPGSLAGAASNLLVQMHAVQAIAASAPSDRLQERYRRMKAKISIVAEGRERLT
jgi:hypothetical protein